MVIFNSYVSHYQRVNHVKTSMICDDFNGEATRRGASIPPSTEHPSSHWPFEGNGTPEAITKKTGEDLGMDNHALNWTCPGLVGGLEHGFYEFPHTHTHIYIYIGIIGNVIIPTDELIFFRGLKPPTSDMFLQLFFPFLHFLDRMSGVQWGSHPWNPAGDSRTRYTQPRSL